MAQPPEAAAPLRLQSSLDSAPLQPRVQQPNLDALVVEQKHRLHHSQHPQQPREQQQQHQQQQQTQIPDNAQPSGRPETSNAPAVSSGTNSTIEPRGTHSPGIGNAKIRVEATLPVDAGSDSHASATTLDALGAPGTHDTQRDTQHNGGAPGLADMSNTQPAPGPSRQPVTYASPASYPTAGIPPVSPYLYSTQPIPSDPYRPNPTTLPSMRTLDHRQPQAHGIPMSAHLASPVTPAPAPAHMAYYGVHPHSHMYGLPDPNAMRFALAPGLGHDPRIALSGGRHKKVPSTHKCHNP
jgi:hypothetical protein